LETHRMGGFEHTGAAKLNGAALYVPSGPTVEIKATGRGPMAVPRRSCSSIRPVFAASIFIFPSSFCKYLILYTIWLFKVICQDLDKKGRGKETLIKIIAF